MAGQKRVDHKGRILKDGESQRKDGIYRYTYTDANGNRHDVYSNRLVPTDKAIRGNRDGLSLREKEKTIQKDLADGIKTQVENKDTIISMFEKYMKSKPELKGTTRSSYRCVFDCYIRNTIGNMKISKVKYSDVKMLYNDILYKKNLSLGSLKNVHHVLHPIFTMAVRDGYIRVNPAATAMAEICKSHAKYLPKKHALSEHEQTEFINFIRENPRHTFWLPLFVTLLGTGGRIGEITALRWQDCDFKNDMITINHNMVYRKFEGDDMMKFHIVTPKTESGIRTIPMLSTVKDVLLSEYARQQECGFIEFEIEGYSGFIFQNQYGHPLSSHAVNNAIDKICNEYNSQELANAQNENREPNLIREFSAHCLRHTFCTRFCENETNIKVIQEIMGHADIETTLNIYAEVTDEKKKSSFANLEGKIKIF